MASKKSRMQMMKTDKGGSRQAGEGSRQASKRKQAGRQTGRKQVAELLKEAGRQIC